MAYFFNFSKLSNFLVCDICKILYTLKNSGPYSITKSARPLKEFVARFKPDFQSNRQQDCSDFFTNSPGKVHKT